VSEKGRPAPARDNGKGQTDEKNERNVDQQTSQTRPSMKKGRRGRWEMKGRRERRMMGWMERSSDS
jgi:hypothetical protein